MAAVADASERLEEYIRGFEYRYGAVPLEAPPRQRQAFGAVDAPRPEPRRSAGRTPHTAAPQATAPAPATRWEAPAYGDGAARSRSMSPAVSHRLEQPRSPVLPAPCPCLTPGRTIGIAPQRPGPIEIGPPYAGTDETTKFADGSGTHGYESSSFSRLARETPENVSTLSMASGSGVATSQGDFVTASPFGRIAHQPPHLGSRLRGGPSTPRDGHSFSTTASSSSGCPAVQASAGPRQHMTPTQHKGRPMLIDPSDNWRLRGDPPTPATGVHLQRASSAGSAHATVMRRPAWPGAGDSNQGGAGQSVGAVPLEAPRGGPRCPMAGVPARVERPFLQPSSPLRRPTTPVPQAAAQPHSYPPEQQPGAHIVAQQQQPTGQQQLPLCRRYQRHPSPYPNTAGGPPALGGAGVHAGERSLGVSCLGSSSGSEAAPSRPASRNARGPSCPPRAKSGCNPLPEIRPQEHPSLATGGGRRCGERGAELHHEMGSRSRARTLDNCRMACACGEFGCAHCFGRSAPHAATPSYGAGAPGAARGSAGQGFDEPTACVRACGRSFEPRRPELGGHGSTMGACIDPRLAAQARACGREATPAFAPSCHDDVRYADTSYASSQGPSVLSSVEKSTFSRGTSDLIHSGSSCSHFAASQCGAERSMLGREFGDGFTRYGSSCSTSASGSGRSSGERFWPDKGPTGEALPDQPRLQEQTVDTGRASPLSARRGVAPGRSSGVRASASSSDSPVLMASSILDPRGALERAAAERAAVLERVTSAVDRAQMAFNAGSADAAAASSAGAAPAPVAPAACDAQAAVDGNAMEPAYSAPCGRHSVETLPGSSLCTTQANGRGVVRLPAGEGASEVAATGHPGLETYLHIRQGIQDEVPCSPSATEFDELNAKLSACLQKGMWHLERLSEYSVGGGCGGRGGDRATLMHRHRPCAVSSG